MNRHIEKIKEKLLEIDSNVQKGICQKKDNIWDCLLLSKGKFIKSNVNKNDLLFYMTVRVIRENEIPEGLELKIIQKMKEAGMKLSDSPASYEYVMDSGEIVVEICKMEFVKTVKGCEV